MTEIDTAGTDTNGFAFVGAVHNLLNSSASSEKADLLLAAVLQALYEFDRDLSAIVERVEQIWPGAVQSDADIEAALDIGIRLRLVARTDSLDADGVWTLTKNGADDVRQHVTWVQDLRTRALEQVRQKAVTGLQSELSAEHAGVLLDHLVHALGAVIRASQAPYAGQIDALLHTGRANQRVSPRGLDRDALLDAVGRGADPGAEFLRGLALSAIDPIDPFGNELVSHITTGCILYAFVAGVDRQRLLARLGTPVGQRVVLDSPVLLDLLGPRRVAVSLEKTIRTALSSGWEVIVLEHSIEEVREVLHREVPEIEESLRTALSSGTQSSWYASLTEDQLPSLCVEVLRDGTYSNLDQLLVAVDRLGAVLEGLGIVVRPHGNGEDDSSVDRCHEALTEQLSGYKKRSAPVMQRDADSMAVVWRSRRRTRTGRWPGGWIVTKDRAMAPAYLRIQPHDQVPLTLTAGQWATLISISAEPVEVEDLARAAADQFVDEAAWTLPVRYPPEVALELARQLSPEHGGSDTDLRMAQMTLDEALEAPDSSAIASMVLSGRTRRVNSISQADRDRWSQGLATEREDAKAARIRAAEETAARIQSEQVVESLGADKERLSTDLSWSRRQLRRVLISAGIGLVSVAVLTVNFFVAGLATIVVLAVRGLVLAYSLTQWCRERQARVWPILVGATINVIGVISGVMQIFKIGPF